MEQRRRSLVNALTLATPLGLLLAVAGGARVQRGPHGLLLARGDRLPLPARGVPAFTVGDVVLLRVGDEVLARRPGLLAHELRHAEQWARWAGPWGFVPAYAAASALSWWRTRDPAVANRFEVAAGLDDGGYAARAAAAAGRVRPGRSPRRARR